MITRARLSSGRVLTLVLGMIVPGSFARAQHTAAEQYLFDAVNSARASEGLIALTWSDGLTDAAAGHADRMRHEDALSHQFNEEADLPERAAATGVRFSIISENVGLGDSALGLHTAWMDSPGHRENILDPGVNMVGIAVRERSGELWAVQDFAKMTMVLSLEEQEQQVAKLLSATGVRTVAGRAAAREACQAPSGYVGGRPAFVLRFTSTDLTRLPPQLAARLSRGTVSEAAVGACEVTRQTFASYRIAVVLYR